MKKITKTLLAALSVASLVGLASCGEPTKQPTKNETPSVEVTPTPTPTPSPTPEVTPVAEFKGAVKIGETDYNVVLALYEDKTVTLKPGNGAAEKTGTYTLVEGKGYEFVIGGQEFETKYNADSKSHEFDYELKLGEAGKGTVTLALKDENFTVTVKAGKEAYVADAKFVGTLEAFGSHQLELVFNEDGTYNITTTTEMAFVKGLLEKTGAYTFTNNVFAITIDGTEYKSVFNPYLGLYELTYTVKGSDGNFPVTLVYQPGFTLTGTAADFGGLTFDLHVYSDGTCFADITTTMESMNAIFDRKGTWKVVENNYVFSIVQGENVVDFTSKIDAETKLLAVDYSITGDREVKCTMIGSPVILSGEVSNMGGIIFDLKFTSATECFIDITSKAAASMNAMFDHAATYEIVDGQIVLTAKGKTYTSTFDEATGSYKITYEFQGQDGSFYPELVFGVWEN